MKYEKILSLCTLFCLMMTLTSCNKDKTINETKLSEFRSDGSNSDQQICNYRSLEVRHSAVAKTLSVFFQAENVRTAFDSYTKLNENTAVLLADFFFNKVIDDQSLRESYPESSESTFYISLCDLINDYLKDYPSIEISFIQDSNEAEFPDIININGFETVSVYCDIDNYPVYTNGTQSGSYHVSDEPEDITILKLQSSDVYTIIDTDNITTENSDFKYADLVICQTLKTFIDNKPLLHEELKSINGCDYFYPLSNKKVLLFDKVYSSFNESCGVPYGLPTGSDDSVEPRSGCDRDQIYAVEHIRDVRGINGKTIFRSCDKWCSYWDKNCVFQVDVFIPTAAPEAGEYSVLGALVKVFSLNEKRLRKGWNTKREIPVTEWLHLSEKHGDEWQYTWTGRHRKRGTSSETTTALGLSAKIGFKVGPVTMEFGPSSNISRKVTRANEDCPLGSDIARYCSALQEQMHLGDIDFKLNEQ